MHVQLSLLNNNHKISHIQTPYSISTAQLSLSPLLSKAAARAAAAAAFRPEGTHEDRSAPQIKMEMAQIQKNEEQELAALKMRLSSINVPSRASAQEASAGAAPSLHFSATRTAGNKMFPAVLGGSLRVVDARASRNVMTSALEENVRGLEQEFEAKALQDEQQIKAQLGLIQNILHHAQTKYDDQMKVVIKSGKDKVKELLDKELSASAALVASNKASQLTARLFKVQQAEKAQEQHIKKQLLAAKMQEQTALQIADPARAVAARIEDDLQDESATRALSVARATADPRTAAARAKHLAAQRAAIETQAENEVDKSEAAAENKEHSRLQHVLGAALTPASPASPASGEAAAQRLAEKRQRALLLLRERTAIEAEAEHVVEESESAAENKERLEVKKERYNISR